MSDTIKPFRKTVKQPPFRSREEAMAKFLEEMHRIGVDDATNIKSMDLWVSGLETRINIVALDGRSFENHAWHNNEKDLRDFIAHIRSAEQEGLVPTETVYRWRRPK